MSAAALPITDYNALSDESCEGRIRAAKAALGSRLTILGHHYQRDEVFAHADISGDSLKLSRLAAASDAEYIVFCGVHFMAEVADILSRPEQVVVLPDLAAGEKGAARAVSASRLLTSVYLPFFKAGTAPPATFASPGGEAGCCSVAAPAWCRWPRERERRRSRLEWSRALAF